MIAMHPICTTCMRFRTGGVAGASGLFCAAYPGGIPPAILFSRVDHHLPYAGDQGLQYQPQGDTPEARQHSEDDAAAMLALAGVLRRQP